MAGVMATMCRGRRVRWVHVVLAVGVCAAGCRGASEVAVEPAEAVVVGESGGAARAPVRGAWFWRDGPESTLAGRRAMEDEEVAATLVRGVRGLRIGRVYTAVRDLATESPGRVAAWNARLDAAGIDSHLLLSDTGLLCSAEGLGREVDRSLLEFNASRSRSEERFDGLALDLEPHALGRGSGCKAWRGGTLDDQRELLGELAERAAETRGRMDAAGAKELPLSAALAFWYDDTGGEGFRWGAEAGRDEFFERLGRSLASVTLMTYCTSKVEDVDERSAWERRNFAGEVRVALAAYHVRGGGAECETWATERDVEGFARQLERRLGVGVDFENLSRFVGAFAD